MTQETIVYIVWVLCVICTVRNYRSSAKTCKGVSRVERALPELGLSRESFVLFLLLGAVLSFSYRDSC